MDEGLLETFMRELVHQTHAMRMGGDDYDHAIARLRQAVTDRLERLKDRPRDRQEKLERQEKRDRAIAASLEMNARAFLAAQSMLTAAALVSKMLWMSQPQRPEGCTCPPDPADDEKRARAKTRCKQLRDELKIKGEIPILSNRRVRNSMEHFDDRLDTFFAEDPDANIYDRSIGPRGVISDHGHEPRYLRHLDNTTGAMTVLDDSVLLGEIHDAVIDIGERAAEWLRAHGHVF